MRWTIKTNKNSVVVACLAAAVLTGGCHMMVDPFADELAGQNAVTTASLEGIRASGATPIVHAIDGDAFEVFTKDGSISHGPLYFEDSYAGDGSEDGQFAWTGQDYLHIPVEWGRSILNAVFFPISALDTPPWKAMVSDGYPSRCVWGTHYDAKRRVECH